MKINSVNKHLPFIRIGNIQYIQGDMFFLDNANRQHYIQTFPLEVSNIRKELLY